MAARELFTADDHMSAQKAMQKLQSLDISASHEEQLATSCAAMKKIIPTSNTRAGQLIGRPGHPTQYQGIFIPTEPTTYAIVPNDAEFHTVDLSLYNIAELFILKQPAIVRLNNAYVNCSHCPTHLRCASPITKLDIAVSSKPNPFEFDLREKKKQQFIVDTATVEVKLAIYRAHQIAIPTQLGDNESYEVVRTKIYRPEYRTVNNEPFVPWSPVYKMYPNVSGYLNKYCIPPGVYLVSSFQKSAWHYGFITFSGTARVVIPLTDFDMLQLNVNGYLTELQGALQLVSTNF